MDLKWGIAHDSCRVGDRMPLGAVTVGTVVSVVLHVSEDVRWCVRRVVALLSEQGEWREVQLLACDGGYAASLELAGRPHVAFYVFRLELTDGQVAYYVPRHDGRSTTGELVWPGADGEWGEDGWTFYERHSAQRPADDFSVPEVPHGFQVTVYDGAFQTPEWMAGAIMYQVFPDRFARGSGGVRQQGLTYHATMRRPVALHDGWGEPVEWTGDPHYDPIDFYGGTLDGIREKLPYIASLGVEVIYLNPIFEARSNHRYDTADYERIDPLLGDENSFRRLAEEASQLGIALVLDAVLSHTGNDSRYFNALENYEAPGAVQGASSPFFDWYEFTYQDGKGPGYKSWWGFPSLPEVDERQASWQRYMFGDDDSSSGDGKGDDALPLPGGSKADDVLPGAAQRHRAGVLPHWLAAGARGYRLDVADEVPDDVLAAIRACVKQADPQAVIIGEVWEDATTKTSYGTPRDYALGPSLDSVMNYPLRTALIGFALGTIDAQQLATFLKRQQANYPPPMYRCLMNLLSSHDVERVRSVLSLGGSVKQLSREGQLAVVSSISARRDKKAAQLQRLIAGLMYALPGTPCIYYGDERGLQGGGDPFCRATFPWDDQVQVQQRGASADGAVSRQAREAKAVSGNPPKSDACVAAGKRSDCGVDLTVFYQKLGTMRKSSQPLRKGECLVHAPSDDVVCVVRTLPDGSSALAIANRSRKRQEVVVDVKQSLGVNVSFSSLSVEDGLIRAVAKPCETVFYF